MSAVIKKVCLIGDPGVGKTSLVRRFVSDQFDDSYLTTIGAKVTKKVIDVPGPATGRPIRLTMMIWDVAGQKEYSAFHKMYLEGVEGVMGVVDITRRATLENLRIQVSAMQKSHESLPVVGLVNKCDLKVQAAITDAEMAALSKEWNVPLLQTSAKTGANVELAFRTMAECLIKSWRGGTG